jgi:hypothetical protein
VYQLSYHTLGEGERLVVISEHRGATQAPASTNYTRALQASATLLLRRVPKSVTFPGSNLRDLRIAANHGDERASRYPAPPSGAGIKVKPSGAAQP